jgi:hypothetical protein
VAGNGLKVAGISLPITDYGAGVPFSLAHDVPWATISVMARLPKSLMSAKAI